VAFESLWLTFSLRARLLLRQRTLLGAVVLSFLVILLSLVLARISWVQPEKIFWDFSLSVLFVLAVFLSSYLAANLLREEQDRRTLHLVLSSGCSRGAWLVGNFLGMFASVAAVTLAGFLFALLVAKVSFQTSVPALAVTATLGIVLESAVLLALALFASFFVRPLLALLLTLALTVALHSLSSLQRVFTDPVTGGFLDTWPLRVLLKMATFFPPLEWFDLKPLVGYESTLPAHYLVSMLGLCLFWSGLYLVLAQVRFERMDL